MLITNLSSRFLGGNHTSKGISGPGQPLLAGYPMGLLLLLTYSATVVEET